MARTKKTVKKTNAKNATVKQTKRRSRPASAPSTPPAERVIVSEQPSISISDLTMPRANASAVTAAVEELVGPGARGSPIRSPALFWNDFQARFPEWVAAQGFTDRPVYYLPEAVIEHFADPSRLARRPRLRSLFDPAQAEAERAFTRLCRECGSDVVGIWKERPIRYGLLTDPPPSVTPEQFETWGWGRNDLNSVVEQVRRLQGLSGSPARTTQREGTPEGRRRDLNTLEARAREYRQELLGWVGWVLFSPESCFRTELAEIRRRDHRLGGVLRLPFRPAQFDASLPSSGTTRTATGDVRLDRRGTELLQSTIRLVWNYQLSELVTWDLPEPQGILESVPLAIAARVLNPDQRVLIVPAFSNRPANDELAQFLRRLQRTNAQACGLGGQHPVPGIAGRMDQPSDYGRAFQFWFVENATRARFAGRDVPRGLVARLSEVLMEEFELSAERVKEIRKIYTGVFDTASPRGRRQRPG